MHVCSHGKCQRAAISQCSGCKCAFYCGLKCQKGAWKLHKKWCKLIGTSLPRPSLDIPTITFLGQSSASLRELSQDKTIVEAVKPRAGWRSLPNDIQLEEDTFPLGETVNMDKIREIWKNKALVIPRRLCQLQLSYCLGTCPTFLLEAPSGARGFTSADLIAATALAYQWCYEKEDAVTTPGFMGALINRGPTNGTFLGLCQHLLSLLSL